MGLVSSIVAILTVVIGLVVRSTVAYTRLSMEVHGMMSDYKDHVVEERGERVEQRTMMGQRLDNMAETLSRVDRDLARLSGRRRDAGTA